MIASTDNQLQAVLLRDPRHPIGGYENWCESLIEHLPRQGVAVTLLVPGDQLAADAYARRWSGTQVRRIDAVDDDEQQARIILDELSALAKAGNRGVFFTMGYSYMSIVGGNLQRSPWTPIPVMHGRHPSNFDWMCVGPPRCVIVPAEDFAEQCQRELASRIGRIRTLGKVMVIPHGVPLPDMPQIDAKLQRPLEPTLRLAVVSRLHEKAKRPWDYLTIAGELVKRRALFEMTIIGDGPCLQSMRQQVANGPLSECVDMPGPMDRSEVYRQLLKRDVLVATSETEAFGLSVAEALACGCAVVSSDLPGAITSMVVNDRTGYRVGVGDVDGFADRIAKLADDMPTARAMGLAGHELVREKYSDQTMAQAYAQIVRTKSPTGSVTNWTPPQPLATTPGQAVGQGLASRMGIGKAVRLLRRKR